MPPGSIGSSINGSLLLEEPLIRTPYELLRRAQRSAQRQVEKDFLGVQSVLSNLLKSFDDKPLPEEMRVAAAGKLDQASERIRGLKRKLDDLQPSESAPTPLRSRIRYLDGIVKSGAAGATREVEVKIEPADGQGEAAGDGMAGIKVEVRPVGEINASQQEGKAGEKDKGDRNVEIKEEAMDVEGGEASGEGEHHERATSPVAPEPVMEDTTLDRYIVDYLLRTGRQSSAKALAEKRGIEPLVDLKLFAELNKIETALLQKQSVAEALAWCGENRGTLKKTKNNLEFALRLQEFIELCRKRDTVGAIAYSRKNLAAWAGSHMVELQQGMTLLAFGEKTGVGLYRRLYDPSRWKTVRDQFRETFLNLYALPSQPLLSLALSAGLSSLRLHSCAIHPPQAKDDSTMAEGIAAPGPASSAPASAANHGASQGGAGDGNETASRGRWRLVDLPPAIPREARTVPPGGNPDCPTCGEYVRVLAQELPMSHHVNSTIVCRISGQVMDSENEPMAFPNGFVYSSKALTEMANNNFDVVTCPRTRESCALSRLRKVYIS